MLAAIIYFTGLYTYFIRTEINEELPSASPVAETSVMPSPRVLAEGNFGKIDVVHQGSGQAKLVEIGDARIVRLENFSVVSGPDLYVYLTTSSTPTGDPASLGDFINLGLLKATMGNQNYDIPAGTADDYRTVVIWCKRYGVLFTFAVMQ